jgi:hypothetical protein
MPGKHMCHKFDVALIFVCVVGLGAVEWNKMTYSSGTGLFPCPPPYPSSTNKDKPIAVGDQASRHRMQYNAQLGDWLPHMYLRWDALALIGSAPPHRAMESGRERERSRERESYRK